MPRVELDDVRDLASRLSRQVTTPAYLEMVENIRAVSAPERFDTAQRGIERVRETTEVPEGFRLSPRAFERPSDAVVHYDDAEGSGSVVMDGTIVTVKDVSGGERPHRDSNPPEEIRSAIRRGIEEIGVVAAAPAFQAMLDELYGLPEPERPAFVRDVVLDAEERRRRGVELPDDMFIQRSEFWDRRPTLFCVSKILPLAYPWHKVTITFDSR